MPLFMVQYLEDSPDIASITPQQARAKLQAAGELLPLAAVLLGWRLPDAVIQACRAETTRTNTRLYRWQPLLTGDGEFMPRPEWQTIGLQGERVPGFQNMPEFTFVCPNRPNVREAVLEHLHKIIQRDVVQRHYYDGFFLDRIRFPSPAAEPDRWLACFCADCQRAALDVNLDLRAVQRSLQQWLIRPDQLAAFVQTLLGGGPAPATDSPAMQFKAFLEFRQRSITNFVQAAAALIRSENLAVGLDCFSPALTQMVGQDLAALDPWADWTKVMSYAHTLGPAGLPFELLGLIDWLVDKKQVREPEALAWLAAATGFSLPSSRTRLRQNGLAPTALVAEMAGARTMGVKQLVAGVELVEIAEVANLTNARIEADHRALHQTDIDGLVLSWDLWHMPLDRLSLVHSIWK
ncbi:MAG: hypothetical protein NT075_33865 [Chloroflexi bacterium]|nr:hypothetical protein [Chloroflexota bacterium]